MSLAQIFRNSNQIIRNTVSLRAPKKKKGGAGGASKEEISSDLVNIFKDKKDNDIKPLGEYPPWLIELTLPQSPPSVYHMAWQNDDDVYKPSSKDMVRYIKSVKRERMKMNNYNRAIVNTPLDEQVTHPYLKNLFMQAKAEKDEGSNEGEEEEGEEEE